MYLHEYSDMTEQREPYQTVVLSIPLWANSANEKIYLSYFLFQFDISVCLKCQSLFSGKNKTNITKTSSAKIFTQHTKH